MSEVAATLGIAPTFPFDGKQYTVSEVTFELEGLLEAKMMQNEMDGIARIEPNSPDNLIDRMLRNLGLNMGSRKYSWLSPDSWAYYRGTIPGRKYVALLRLQAKATQQQQVSVELIDRIFADQKAWKLLWAIFDWIDDPNRSGQCPTGETPASTV